MSRRDKAIFPLLKNLSADFNAFLLGRSRQPPLCRCARRATEQRIFAMFWGCKEKGNLDGITQLHELTIGKRTKDPWLQEVLAADREGREEMFTYFDTKGVKHAVPIARKNEMKARGNPLQLLVR